MFFVERKRERKAREQAMEKGASGRDEDLRKNEKKMRNHDSYNRICNYHHASAADTMELSCSSLARIIWLLLVFFLIPFTKANFIFIYIRFCHLVFFFRLAPSFSLKNTHPHPPWNVSIYSSTVSLISYTFDLKTINVQASSIHIHL